MNSLLSLAFGVIIIMIGLFIAGTNLQTVAEGLKIGAIGEPVAALVTGKRVEAPHRSSNIHFASVSVNGIEMRDMRTYYRDYFLKVRYEQDGAVREALAPVGYGRFREERKGNSISVRALPGGGPYVDADDRGTLLYGLKRIAIGVLMLIVGAVALKLRNREEPA